MSSPRHPADRQRTAGFALLEVLVAVAVAAVLMTALMKAFAANWSGISMVRQEIEGVLVARAILTATGSRANIADTNQNGVIGAYRWAMTVEQMPMAALPPTGANTPTGANAANPDNPNPAPTDNPNPWKLYKMQIVVTAPNGRRTNLDTFRLGRLAQ